MDVKRLKQIEEIYYIALETAPAERDAFFENRCGQDAALHREVESLLSFDDTFDSLLDAPLESLAAEILFECEKTLDLAGRKISYYKIEKLLGSGGMGEVYLAEDTRLDRKAALKILPSLLAADKERMSRFVREAKFASSLNHPNILTIYEIGEFEGVNFIATEFVDGKTLNHRLKSDPLDLKNALDVAIQIASALDEAHSAGIVHRNIKPDNVMVRPSGLVKILDFGIAKLSGSADQPLFDRKAAASIKVTNPHTIVGTVNYMSPEQAKGKEVDARTDIFSFGVVLYEMISSGLPFKSETAMETIAAILHKEPLPLDSGVPTKIKKIIGKCLKKERAERYQTISEADEAVKTQETVVKENPLDAGASSGLETVYLFAGRYDDAIEQGKKTLELDQNNWGAYWSRGQALERKKQYAEAIESFEKARVLAGKENTSMWGYLGYTYAVAGRRAEAVKTLNELKELSKHQRVSPYSIAVIYAGLGDKDRSLRVARRSIQSTLLFPDAFKS